MIEFFGGVLDIWESFVDFFFEYSLSGVPLGYIFLACIVFTVVVRYLFGVIK